MRYSKILLSEATLENGIDRSTREYALGILNRMVGAYADHFEADETQIDKFKDGIMPGAIDFCSHVNHTFGAASQPAEMVDYQAFKAGCWINSLKFVEQFGKNKPNYKLAHGLIVSDSDLLKIESEINEGRVPVFITFIKHGFIAVEQPNGDYQIFDPTLGINERYHYFWEFVPEKIWSNFEYSLDREHRTWNISSFANYTTNRVLGAKLAA